jgi:hypothetical protein
VPVRTLTERELNRALLARQLLLERTSIPLPRALERIGGIQAQYAPSMYIGLWSRLEGFRREQLTRALERRSVVQGTLMRVTIHLVSTRDWWPLAAAIREPRLELWLKAHRGTPSAREVRAAARRLRPRLADGPLSRKELEQVIGKDPRLVNAMNVALDLVRVPPSGTWDRRRADLYAAAEEWLGPGDGQVEAGRELLVRRYLSGFGPGSRKEIGDWAGVPPKTLDPVLERLTLRRFRTEAGEALLDLPRQPLPDAETPAPVRFLPPWDATLLVHARRTGILPEEYRPRVFNTKTPQSVATFLIDGRVAGTWRLEDGRIRTEPFHRLSASVQRELGAEGRRLADLYG